MVINSRGDMSYDVRKYVDQIVFYSKLQGTVCGF